VFEQKLFEKICSPILRESKGKLTENSFKDKMQNIAPNPNRRARNARNQMDDVLKKCHKNEV